MMLAMMVVLCGDLFIKGVVVKGSSSSKGVVVVVVRSKG